MNLCKNTNQSINQNDSVINLGQISCNHRGCNNCWKQGHLYHQCKLPITSYGVIAFRTSNVGLQYLMIRRKNTFGYIDFVRGKYILNNKVHLNMMINEMSIEEKRLIKQETFDTLWREMWNITDSPTQYSIEENSSQKKFQNLKTGILINNEFVSIDSLIDESDTAWDETEWEFPKGRKNYQEKNVECSIREFEEETGYSHTDFMIIENIFPLEETFIGSDYKAYKHKYYIAYMHKQIDKLDRFQSTEVSKLEWKTYQECLDSIRPYHYEKKKLLTNLKILLEENQIL
jgi:8-oxo-dGTP pyrophosphatase MutT (NUDIX family)